LNSHKCIPNTSDPSPCKGGRLQQFDKPQNVESEEVKIEEATSHFVSQVQEINPDLFADENWHAYTSRVRMECG
jgi:tRNA/tmRNA/rRNA uracil-C5-methylase (TrmA/RlmC/RlmD family)